MENDVATTCEADPTPHAHPERGQPKRSKRKSEVEMLRSSWGTFNPVEAQPATRPEDAIRKLFRPSQETFINRASASFPFLKLPRELQRLVWGFAIPTFIEATYRFIPHQFFTNGTRDAILCVAFDCGETYATLDMKPVYLTPRVTLYDTRTLYDRRNTPKRNTVVEPIFIRPKLDTLYIPFPKTLDPEALLARPENHIIESLGLTLPRWIFPRWCGTQAWSNRREEQYGNWGRANELGYIIRGLRNLREINVVDGKTRDDECGIRIRRRQIYEFTFRDLQNGDGGKRYGQPWNTDCANLISRDFEAEIKLESEGKYRQRQLVSGHWFVGGEEGSWTPPKLKFRELQREIVDVGHIDLDEGDDEKNDPHLRRDWNIL